MTRWLVSRTVAGLPLVDLVLAAALCALAVGGLLSGQVQEKPLAVTLPIAAISTLVVAFRRRYPIPVVGAVAALAVTQGFVTGDASSTLWALVVFLLCAYTVAAECDESWALVGLSLVLASQFMAEWLADGTDYPFDVLVFGGVWLFGRGTRSWRTRATHAERHRDELARIAVADERTRIARELHDVVAHSLSVIAVQADAAEAALDQDPRRAAAPMRAIRASAREALGDMRQLLHVLRADGDASGDLAPAKGLDDLAALVGEVRASGLDVSADIRPGAAISSGLQLTIYRIAQEGLTNVRKHAGIVPARLVVAGDGDTVLVEIRNECPQAPPVSDPLSTGHGLVGLRERVHAAGGEFRASQTDLGGFALVARLPLGVAHSNVRDAATGGVPA